MGKMPGSITFFKCVFLEHPTLYAPVYMHVPARFQTRAYIASKIAVD